MNTANGITHIDNRFLFEGTISDLATNKTIEIKEEFGFRLFTLPIELITLILVLNKSRWEFGNEVEIQARCLGINGTFDPLDVTLYYRYAYDRINDIIRVTRDIDVGSLYVVYGTTFFHEADRVIYHAEYIKVDSETIRKEFIDKYCGHVTQNDLYVEYVHGDDELVEYMDTDVLLAIRE
jgi:hypothetical protein